MAAWSLAEVRPPSAMQRCAVCCSRTNHRPDRDTTSSPTGRLSPWGRLRQMAAVDWLACGHREAFQWSGRIALFESRAWPGA